MEWETWSVHDLDTGIDDLADKLKYTGWHDILPARSSNCASTRVNRQIIINVSVGTSTSSYVLDCFASGRADGKHD